MGKRNQKTTIVANPIISQLTESILQRMGPEGEAIRERLLRFLKERMPLKPDGSADLVTTTTTEPP